MRGMKRKICVFKHILKMVSSICKHVAQPSKDPEATGLSQAGTHTDQRGPEEHHSFTPLLSSFQHPTGEGAGGISFNLPLSSATCRHLLLAQHHKWAPQPPTAGTKVEHVFLGRSKSTLSVPMGDVVP